GPRRAGPRFGGIPAPAPGDGAVRRNGRARPAACGEPATDPRAGQVAGGGGDHGKNCHGLLETISESTGRAVAAGAAMNTAFAGLRAAGVPIWRACVLAGRARATHYRHAL